MCYILDDSSLNRPIDDVLAEIAELQCKIEGIARQEGITDEEELRHLSMCVNQEASHKRHGLTCYERWIPPRLRKAAKADGDG